MLSRSVHTAALAHARQLTTDHSEGALVPLVDCFETGYSMGFRARPVVHQFPLSGQREFLRLLGPYVAEKITVYHPATGRYGLLRGLPATYAGQGEPLADVEFYADAEAREEGGGDALDDVSRILPCLYGFEDLPKIMGETPWGTAPASVILVRMITNLQVFTPNVKAEKTSLWAQDYPTGPFKSVLHLDTVEQGRLDGEIVNWLRQHHFAVGLAPHQYHRRVAGFDYASGGRPEKCQQCPGKEVCRG